MSRPRARGGPANPVEIARRRAEERERAADPQNWGLAADALALPSNRAIAARVDLAGRTVRARRLDVFDTLNARGRLGPAALAAVRRLQEDMACLHRTASGGSAYAPRVDRSPDPQGFSDSRRRAGERIEAALTFAGTTSARLLAALCEADVVLASAADWRAVVARETGERLHDAQGAILRMACENLAGAYSLLDRRQAP